MLTTASQFGPRARSVRTNHATATATATAHRVLGISAAFTLQQCQQTRDFRFGSWFTHLDSEIQEKIRRRHEKNVKQRYLRRFREDLDDHPLANDARHAVKRMMATYWLSHDQHPCGRHENAGSSKQSTPDKKHGVRPGQNIEDVERGAVEHLIFGSDEEAPAHGPKTKKNRGGKQNKQDHLFSGYPIEQDDYFIDPVTNRKVAKHPSPTSPDVGVDILAKTFGDYSIPYSTRSYAFRDCDAVRLNEFRKASRVEAETNAEHPGGPSRPSENPVGGDARHNEQARVQDFNPEFDDLHKYKPVLDEGQVSSEALPQPYADVDNYEPVKDKEPVQFNDLKPPHQYVDKYNEAVVDEIVARFYSDKAPSSDLHGYSQAFASENALGKEAAPSYNNLENIRPAASVEPAARRTEVPAPEANLDDYTPPEPYKPHEKPLGPQIPVIGPPWMSVNRQPLVRNLEPGDFHPSTVEQLREKYGAAELRTYTVVGNAEAKRNSSSSVAARVTERSTEKYQPEELDSDKPVHYNESDGNPLPSAEERFVEDPTKRYDPEELAKYTPVYYRNEPDGQPTLTKDYDPAEPAIYKTVYSSEPDGQPLPAMDKQEAEKLTKMHGPGNFKGYERPVRWNAEDNLTGQGDAARSGLEEMDVLRDYGKPVLLGPEELDRADESSAEVLRRIRESQQQLEEDSDELDRRLMLESQMKKYQAASDVTDHEASLAVKSARARAANAESERQLTGNYVRDFPEEFEKSWAETLSTAPTEKAQPDHEFVFESQNMDGGLEGAFGRPSPIKIQPALDRRFDKQPPKATQGIGSEYSDMNSAQEVKTTDASANDGTAASSAHVNPHGNICTAANTEMESTNSDTTHRELMNEPTLYKILAYDPTMQKIEIAETSLFVPDTASALTPVDALLRLSHPTRFFPHFGPLQAEGYEIVSGIGDVLVFRKVRPGDSKGRPVDQTRVLEQSVPAEDEPGEIETRINPIDMTGKPKFSPASANFASPTGYVNYENIPETAGGKLPPPPPKIKYNIDVHREEPVFSGPKARIDEKRGKKTGLGKRLIVGGVWVAGISYALGVISEYFSTGGMDGLGPKGL
ncbi:hypothetical protein DHEL01_v204127 [Diaporthe helianthi]|uniref:Uncharacterized protein n=1 Tax=Diaporthe helianthi TaxID=158607 RepID=A0A2P5I4M5_DIAHE|nr:hypothetical protein DHEL01_v204127 [Diaporthe helianthi]